MNTLDPADAISPRSASRPVLAGQIALVTGANSGIGKAAAIGLGKAGADVIVNFVADNDAADAVVAEIEAAGSRAIAIKADVSKETEVQAMFRQVMVRNAAHPGQQCRPAARRPVRRNDARPMERRHRRQPDRAVPLRPRGGPRVQAPPGNTSPGRPCSSMAA